MRVLFSDAKLNELGKRYLSSVCVAGFKMREMSSVVIKLLLFFFLYKWKFWAWKLIYTLKRYTWALLILFLSLKRERNEFGN